MPESREGRKLDSNLVSVESWDPRFKLDTSSDKPFEQLFHDTSYSSLNGALREDKDGTPGTSKSLVVLDSVDARQNEML